MLTPRSSELELLLREVRRFGGQLDNAGMERAGRIHSDVLERLRDLGLFGLALPETHGGAGLPLGDACAVIEELAFWDRSVATMLGLHTGLGTRAVARHATPELADAILPKLACGAWIGAFAATEASAGSDLMAIRTTARRDGSVWIVDGEKSYVTNGRIAGCYTTLVRVGERAHALVLVPAELHGVEVGPEENKLGIRASSTVAVSFTNVRVPASHVLGPSEQGLESAYEVLAWGRTLMAAGCIGTARAALDATVAHVATRKQFRRPLVSFGAVNSHIARIAVMNLAARALAGEAAAALARGERGDLLTMAVKVFASEHAFDACDTAIQLHGALGVMEDTGIARLLRDCRVTRIFEGANDVLSLRLGAARLASHERFRRVATASEAGVACNLLADTLDAAFSDARSAYGATIISRQGVLLRLAKAEIAHAAAVAVASYSAADASEATLAVRLLVDDARAQLNAIGAAPALEKLASRVADRIVSEREPGLARTA